MHLYILAPYGEGHMMIHYLLPDCNLGVAVCRHLFPSLRKGQGLPTRGPHPHIDVSHLPTFRLFIQSGQSLPLEDAGREPFSPEDFRQHRRIVPLPAIFFFHLLHQQFPRPRQFQRRWGTCLLPHGLLHPTIADSGQRMATAEFKQDYTVLPFGRQSELPATVKGELQKFEEFGG